MCTCVGFEVPTAVVMKSSILWDTTPCSPLKVPLKRLLTFNGIHGVIFQKIVLFKRLAAWKTTKKVNGFRIRDWYGRTNGNRSGCLNGSRP
jgi:hypothetical protein